ncbi:MAG: prolipoprotein diacylglyceryl transferase [Proteobacteria bacterium]|nr:prolipoprotein diacylglyceryl transferase [Pseudomonadota bacterium]
MLQYPAINPVAFSLGPVKVHWYGLMYLLGFIAAYALARFRTKRYKLAWTDEEISDLIFYGALGVIIGGRLGYVLFYNTKELIHSPLSIFKIWEGGMSFHGGLIGVLIAMCLFAHRTKKRLIDITDFIAPLIPIGLGLGRIGNFINGELWGRPTNLPWAMVFPTADGQPRHPSQLYEFGLEGVFLFILLWWYTSKPRALGKASGLFLVGYACSRLLIECFREPDEQLGFILFNWLTMGQLLSIPMLIIGFWLLWRKQ